MNANALIHLIKVRHAKDGLVIPECKDGPTIARRDGRLRILDAWVLLRTWSPITTIGYEVKVSRSDWVRDQKFTEYRDLCHLLYVVAPKGVVPSAELPAGIGLMEVIGKGSGMRLVTRQKAARRDIALPTDLMAYVLMSRVVVDERSRDRVDRAAMWREWVESRGEFREIGQRVSGRMREIVRDALKRQDEAERRAKSLEVADTVLRSLGIEASPYEWQTRQRIERVLAGGVIPELRRLKVDLDRVSQNVAKALEMLARDPSDAETVGSEARTA